MHTIFSEGIHKRCSLMTRFFDVLKGCYFMSPDDKHNANKECTLIYTARVQHNYNVYKKIIQGNSPQLPFSMAARPFKVIITSKIHFLTYK